MLELFLLSCAVAAHRRYQIRVFRFFSNVPIFTRLLMHIFCGSGLQPPVRFASWLQLTRSSVSVLVSYLPITT